jgi:hypothetical protein
MVVTALYRSTHGVTALYRSAYDVTAALYRSTYGVTAPSPFSVAVPLHQKQSKGVNS